VFRKRHDLLLLNFSDELAPQTRFLWAKPNIHWSCAS